MGFTTKKQNLNDKSGSHLSGIIQYLASFSRQSFPWLEEELPTLTRKQQQLFEVLEMASLENHLPYSGQTPGRPLKSRESIARAFVAKAIYNLSNTEMLLDRLGSDISLRRICGWGKKERAIQ